MFDQFDGERWLPAKNTFGTPPAIVALGAIVDYQITLEPHQQNWLLALDLPINAPSDSVLSRQLQLLRATPITQRLRYHASSTLNWQTLGEDGVAQALQLPENINPKSRALAASWQNLAPAERVQAGLTWLKSNGFSYTLNPPLLRQRNRVDEFLFESKQGYCEHFSSSFAFLMRAANVPARVVTGYQGGLLNPSSNYYIVRQADAHAWIEVWLDGQGWQRVDPTFVISPSRIESGVGTSFQGAGLPMMLRSDNFWLKSVRLKLDVFVNNWNQWVIGYDDKRQLDLLKRLGIEDFLSLTFLLWLAGGVVVSLGGFALWLILSNRPPPIDMASVLYQRYCKQLA
ncbi:MAG: transglutaminase-like domain-containing protein, partial [Deefgea sp.]